MSLHPVRMSLCPCCGLDLARVIPAPDGFRTICDPERGGCGGGTDGALTEAEAVALWNNAPLPAAVLRAAEIRRREVAA